MTAPLGSITVEFHDYLSMVEAFRAIKDHIAISNSDLDALCQFGDGHTDKLLGPTSARGFARDSLDAMLWGLAIKGTLSIDPERARTLEPHWEKRCAANTREKPNRISKKLVKAAQPVVMKEMGRIGGLVRVHMQSASHRSALARKAAKTRWKKSRKRA